MDVVADLPPNPQAAEPVQMGECALYDPAVGDHRFHPKLPHETAGLIVVVPAVTEHDVRATPGPAAFTPHRRNGFEQRNELGHVIAVAPSQGDSERDAGDIGDQVVLAARSTPVDRASSGLGAPFNART